MTMKIRPIFSATFTLAIMTMVTSTVLGVMSAQAFRAKFKGSNVVFYLIVLGMMVFITC